MSKFNCINVLRENPVTSFEEKVIRAVTYARFSSNNQREESIETQESVIINYAQRNNITIVKKFSDKAISGTSVTKRNGFKAMIDYCLEHDDIDVVLCYSLDRFSRNEFDYLKYRDILLKSGKKLCFVADRFETSPQTKIMELFRVCMAAETITTLSRNVSDGLKTNAKHGIHTGGIPCLGYNINKDTKKLEINEDERPIIELIFTMYADGFSYSDIINELNRRHFKTKLGNEFKNNSLHDILTNPKYKGTYIYNRRCAKSSDGSRNNHAFKDDKEMIYADEGCPRIIDDKLWDKVQKRMEDNKNKLRQHSSQEKYLLRDKIFCECGERMYGNRRYSGRNKQLYVTYRCKGRQNKSGCKMREINRDYIESFVIRQIGSFIFNKNNIPKLVIALNEYGDNERGNIKNEIKKYERKVRTLKNKLNNIVNAIANGYTNPKFQEKSDELTKEIEFCYKNIESLKADRPPHFTEEDIFKAKKKFISKIKSNDFASKFLIDHYVDKVIVGDDEIKVILNVDTEVSDCYR